VTVSEVAFVASTVRVEEPEALIEAGLAEMLTEGAAGGGAGTTVTLVLAEAVPAVPVTVAVYVVVAAGLTDCVPPVGWSV
jgi:hypothetical protein